MSKPRILATRKLPQSVEDRLAASFDVTFNATDDPMDTAALATAMADYDALMPTVSDRITSEMMRHPDRRVRIIANVGVGFSNIDTDAARDLGIAVSNTPDVLTDATADIALLLILASTRQAYASEQMLRRGDWAGFSIVSGLGTGVQGATLGIIGMGRIGQATARRAALGLGMKIVYFNRSDIGPFDFPAERLGSIADVMAQSDVVSLHIPGSTPPPVTADHIAAMKPGAHLINTARGDTVDQDALIKALETGRIAGAGLDVFRDEPKVPARLVAMDNVTLLPHIGSATTQVRTAMGMLAADNLDAFFSGAPLPCKVV